MRSPSIRTLVIGAAVLLAAGSAFRSRNATPQAMCCSPLGLSFSAFAAEAAKPGDSNAPPRAVLPRLVDLGADKCIPCKMMAPILQELKTEYAGRMQVEFIDVWKNPDAGKAYKIKLIPTQIFYDAAGKELFRHEGFFAKQDILAKWKELGVGLKSEARHPKAEGRATSDPPAQGSGAGEGGEKAAKK